MFVYNITGYAPNSNLQTHSLMKLSPYCFEHCMFVLTFVAGILGSAFMEYSIVRFEYVSLFAICLLCMFSFPIRHALRKTPIPRD